MSTINILKRIILYYINILSELKDLYIIYYHHV